MASIILSVVFIKNVNCEKVCMGATYSRVDNDEFIKLNFKAFRQDSEDMIQGIRENTIMRMIRRFLNVG